jgi:diguanylate cyclase (GGDEF)-like protein
MGASKMRRAPWSGLSTWWRDADRLVRASAVLTVIALVWFGINMIHPVGPRVLLWLPSPFCGVILVAVYRRTAAAASLRHTRRFWRHLTVVSALVVVASSAQAIDVLATPHISGPHVGRVMQIFDSAAVLIIIYALYRLPLGRQSFGELTRVVLDAGTVLLATAVFMWHFETRVALDGDDRTALYASLVLTLFSLLAVFAVAKVVLSSHSYVNKTALQYFAAAMLVGALGPLFQPYLEVTFPQVFPTQVSMPMCLFLATLAGDRERRAQFGPRRGAGEAHRRPFSMLPYVAVAAVDGLLLVVSWSDDHSDQAVVIAFSVGLTALVVLRQVTAFRDNGRLLARLDHGASHDALTQLPNRLLFNKRLQHALTTPGDRPVAVALIDLDDFKEVNDTLGHEVGDLLLVAVAQRLAGCLRAEDTVARLGGDEFVVVLVAADPAAADLAAERMTDALRQPVLADGHELPIRASIGIADGRTGDEASMLLRHADIAMYAAKKIPGTVHLHYVASMAAAGTDHAHLGAELREAIRGDQLFLLYQPIVALDDGRVMGAEALVRWAHPVHGTLAPDSFIPVAERTGLIVSLGRWVMRTAFRQQAAWIAEHGMAAPGVLNVNVSARDLREPTFAAEVAALLTEFGLTADQITLEITETMALEPGQSVSNLHQLRALGVRISLDDFGTGHSTLTLLHDCPVDEIKLDRSFTQAPIDGRVPVASAVIHLAQALGLHAVAEGVETAEQAEQLLALGYIAAQGYYFARPMPAAAFSEILDSGRSLTPDAAWQMS